MWPLIRKDLLRRWRSPISTLVMIAFPLFMSAALGSVYGGGGGEAKFPAIHILVENKDPDGIVSRALVGALGSPQSADYLDIETVGAEGRDMMEKGKASALVIIPEGFSQAIMESTPTVIHIVRNPAEGIKPEIVATGGELVATYLDQGSRMLGGDLGTLDGMINTNGLPSAAMVGALASRIMDRFTSAQDYLFPPLVTIGSAKEQSQAEDGAGSQSIFGYILVMTTVMALLFVATRSVGDLFEEKNSGMLRRQMGTPLRVSQIVAAKFLFSVVLGLTVMVILAGVGMILGWISPPANPLAAVLLGLTFNLSACGLVAIIIGLVRNEKQAGILSWLIVMGMSAVGGSMIPIEQLPAGMRAAGNFTLNHWAIDGFTKVMFQNAGLGDVVQHLTILLGTGVIFALLANVLLVRRFKEMTP